MLRLEALAQLPAMALAHLGALEYRLLFVAYRLVGPRSWFRAAARHRSRWIEACPAGFSSGLIPIKSHCQAGWIVNRLPLNGD